MYLEKIPEGTVLIEASKGKDPAESGPKFMDTAPVAYEKCTCLFISRHLKIGKYNAVHYIQLDGLIQ